MIVYFLFLTFEELVELELGSFITLSTLHVLKKIYMHSFRSYLVSINHFLFLTLLISRVEDLRVLLLKGFHVIGALAVVGDGNAEQVAGKAVEAARSIRKFLEPKGCRGAEASYPTIGAVADVNTGDIQFFVCSSENVKSFEQASSVVYDNDPEKYVWEDGCLLHCKLPIKLPLYLPLNKKSSKLFFFKIFILCLFVLWLVADCCVCGFSC